MGSNSDKKYARTLYTLGHSNHSIEYFVKLLKKYDIEVVADVRSVPYSRYNPQFKKNNLKVHLREHGIRYVFMGQELGGKPQNEKMYCHGKVNYSQLAETPAFRGGLKRLKKGIEKYRIAVVCAEKDPYTCHRYFLVGAELEKLGVNVRHILDDGSLLHSIEE